MPIETSPAPGMMQTTPLPKKPSLQTQLNEPTLYELLLGEIALQRGDYALAAKTYLELARQTGDARIARRAVEVANQGKLPDLDAHVVIPALRAAPLRGRPALAWRLLRPYFGAREWGMCDLRDPGPAMALARKSVRGRAARLRGRAPE